MCVVYCDGIETSTPKDIAGEERRQASGNSDTTATTTQADELLFGGHGLFASTVAFNPDRLVLAGREPDNHVLCGPADDRCQYQVVAATGAYASTCTTAAGQTANNMIATFKGAAAATTYTLPVQNMSPLTWRT